MKTIKLHIQNQGFTLVEVLVSLFISLFLIGVIVQSYLSHKATFRNTTQVSVLQDNVRFTSYFISQDVREAGNLGCFQDAQSSVLNDPANAGLYNFQAPITIWSFDGTELNDNYTIADVRPVTAGNNSWSDLNGNPLPNILNGRVIEGTDVFVTTSISENLPITLRGGNTDQDDFLNINGNHTLDQGQIVLVGNCQYADIFQHASPATNRLDLQGGALPGNIVFSSGWVRTWQPEDEVRQVNHTAYYIGVGASGTPSLFRMRLDRGLAAAPGLTQELIPNVYNIQLVAAEDRTDDSGNPSTRDQVPDIIVAPQDIQNANDIVNIELGALIAANPDTDLNFTEDIPVQAYTLANSVNITTPESQLNYMTLNRIYRLENRGLERTYSLQEKR